MALDKKHCIELNNHPDRIKAQDESRYTKYTCKFCSYQVHRSLSDKQKSNILVSHYNECSAVREFVSKELTEPDIELLAHHEDFEYGDKCSFCSMQYTFAEMYLLYIHYYFCESAQAALSSLKARAMDLEEENVRISVGTLSVSHRSGI